MTQRDRSRSGDRRFVGGDDQMVRRLSGLVESEAKRVFTDSQLRPDPALVAAGWERRFVTDARRAEEVIALYQDLGFEVRAEPVQPEEVGDDCADCRLLRLQFRTIYTRAVIGNTDRPLTGGAKR